MEHTILIIDAHPVYSFKTEAFLKSLGFKNITIVPLGLEGIKKLDQQRFDLAVVSGMLPDQSSIEVCRQLKAIQPNLKVIVQVGLFTSDEMKAAFEHSGADRIIDRREKDLSPLKQSIDELNFSASV